MRGSREARSLKHRPDGTIRDVRVPAVLVRMLRQRLSEFGTTPDGRLFRGTRGGPLSESVYGRAWHAARQAALRPHLSATPLSSHPYELRHAALGSLVDELREAELGWELQAPTCRDGLQLMARHYRQEQDSP